MDWLKTHNLYRILTSSACELGERKPGACLVVENEKAYMIGVSTNSSGVRQVRIGRLIKESKTAESLDDVDDNTTTVYSMETPQAMIYELEGRVCYDCMN
jgi:hypothetical protein